MNPHDVLVKQKVEMAITQHKLLKFDYVAADLALTKNRIVEPIILLKDKSGEYNRFAGNDFFRQEQRQFSFKGVENLKLLAYDEVYSEKKKEA